MFRPLGGSARGRVEPGAVSLLQHEQRPVLSACLQLQLCPDASRFLLLAARASPAVQSPSLSSLLRTVFPLRSQSLHSCIKLHLVHLQRPQLNCISTPAPTPRHFTSHPLRRTATQRNPPSRLRLVSILPLTANPPIREPVSAWTSDIIRSISWPVCHDRLALLRNRSLPRSPPHAYARCPPLGSLVRSLFQVYNHHSRSLSLSTRSSAIPLCLSLTFKPSRLRFLRCGQQISLCQKGGDRPPGQVNSPALDRRELKRTLHEPLRQPNRTSNPQAQPISSPTTFFYPSSRDTSTVFTLQLSHLTDHLAHSSTCSPSPLLRSAPSSAPQPSPFHRIEEPTRPHAETLSYSHFGE